MGKIQRALAAIVEDRKEIGQISQRELARKVGCSEPQLSSLLSGNRRLNEDWIIKICEALDIRLSDLEKSESIKKDSKELRAAIENLKRLYSCNIHGFNNITRNINDWLSAQDEDKAKNIDRPNRVAG
jgi:transcriptional regulator with XRE-family HTH domain